MFRLILIFVLISAEAYNIPPTGVNRSMIELDVMISQCLQTLCKEWISECHWYCDAVKGQNSQKRCLDCLGWRGGECKECFNL